MSNLPSFLSRQEPKVATQASPSLRQPSPLEAANELGAHMKALMMEREGLIKEVDFQRKMIETLNARLEVAERDLSHYVKKAEYFERFSMSIAANFNTIRMIIDETQRKASELSKEANPPSPEIGPSPDEANAKLEEALTEALHQGGGK